MSDTVKAALIAAVVGVVTAAISAGVTMSTKTAELKAASHQAAEGQKSAKILLKAVGEAETRLAERATPVGTVVASMLDYDEFRRAAGEGWAPADGRSVSTKSKYAELTGRTLLPDLRGMFLRGLNEFEAGKRRADGQEDPDSRKVGDPQADSFRAHDHTYTLRWVGGSRNSSIEGGNSYPRNEEERKTSSTDGKETRPRNVAVSYYIRVN